VFEVDLQEFQTRCEDADVVPCIVPGPARHCIGIEGTARDLVTFVLTVAPYLDDHLETMPDGELDFRPEWQHVEERTADAGRTRETHRWVWPDVRPVHDLNLALSR
jgi:hypothetical protein